MSTESYTRWRCAASDEEEDEGGGGEDRAGLAGRGGVTLVTKPRLPRPRSLDPAAQARVGLVLVSNLGRTY